MELAHTIFEYAVEIAVLLLEAIGLGILVYGAFESIIGIFKHSPHVKLRLAESISLALSFKLGGEVLRTSIVRSWSEVAMLGAIVVLRAAITLLINWEIKNEKSELQLSD